MHPCSRSDDLDPRSWSLEMLDDVLITERKGSAFKLVRDLEACGFMLKLSVLERSKKPPHWRQRSYAWTEHWRYLPERNWSCCVLSGVFTERVGNLQLCKLGDKFKPMTGLSSEVWHTAESNQNNRAATANQRQVRPKKTGSCGESTAGQGPSCTIVLNFN